MRLAQASFDSPRAPLDAYGDGGFRIGGEFRAGSLLVLPQGAEAWPVSDAARLAEAPLGAILAQKEEIELLLVGTGADIRPLPKSLALALQAAGIRFEVMSTRAAARTYNVLLSEDRKVAAALLAVD
ncbi:MAG: hypothetical protein HXY25_08200 [Alphaproteobacteria bacterium]|nr:hypothetical protein [Alphaproteobacteria bacterium]